MVKFIFEDKYDIENLNLTTPSSILLRSCFNRSNIYFSNGNSFLESKLKEIYNKEDLFIVFIDVVPNNKALVSLYRHLVLKIEANDLSDNVVVLPIPCIEYYIIDMLTSLGLIFINTKELQQLYNNLYLDINWSNIPENKKSISLEKLYKEIINLQKPYCLRNKTNINKSYYGDFYRISCDSCSSKSCRKDVNYSLDLKAEALYTSLPIFDVVDTKHIDLLSSLGINFESCNIIDIKSKLQSYYNRLCCDTKVTVL